MIKILVVDDHPGCLDSLRLLLASEGFEVQTAQDGPQAFTVVGAGFRPDILVVDWLLGPPLDGLRVAETIQTMDPRMQTILISGHSAAESDPRLKVLPIVAFLAKPFRSGELLASIEAAVQAQGNR